MTSAVLLDHVSAYASAVRAHLADLSPEQVEDLTDGLEADLAEALEDREGPVVTGEIPIGRAAADAGIPTPPGGASMIDLTRRFGPAGAYAAELRAAAGLGVGSVSRPVPLRAAVLSRSADLVHRAREAIAPIAESPLGRAVVGFLVSLRPLWWVLRGWLWFVILVGISMYRDGSSDRGGLFRFLPRSASTWAVLIGLMVLSVAVGRGLGSRRRWTRGLVTATSVLALMFAPWTASELGRLTSTWLTDPFGVNYVEVPVEVEVPAPVEDGVYIDGMLVSNLFVYDAAGNPLEGVQIYDDRGRQVRTMQTGWADWELPGVAETWRFVAAVDGDGRNRWNVYPLMGAPSSSWDTEAQGGAVLADGEELRMPPLPFAKAPAVAFGSHDSESLTDG